MCKVWLGLAFVAIVSAQPTSAQEYRKNFVECAKAVGFNPPVTGGRPRKWHYHSEIQNVAFMDCVTRKERLAPTSSAKGGPRVSP
jgi:hypothetical protein